MTKDRMAKKRALEKAGMRYVSGWLEKDKAEEVKRMIDDAKPVAEMVVKNERS